jgi:hypothetical protein
MLGARKFGAAPNSRLASLVVARAVMDRGQAAQKSPHRFRKRIVRRIHAGEERIATDRRHLFEVKDRTHRRLCIARNIGMPLFAGNVLRVLVRFDDDDFGMPLVEPERRRMKVQSAEVASEILVLIGRQILITKEED